MRNPIRRIAVVATTLLVGFVFATSAEAAHAKYRYRGTCHNFHGEAHVIQAFALMDKASYSSCRVDRIHTTLAAQREIMTAYREFCDGAARRELIQAKIDLSRFIGHGDACYLDQASQHMHAALAIEQRVHAYKPAHHHRGHGYSGSRPYSPNVGYGPYSGQRSRTQIRLGGSNISLGFSF